MYDAIKAKPLKKEKIKKCSKMSQIWSVKQSNSDVSLVYLMPEEQ